MEVRVGYGAGDGVGKEPGGVGQQGQGGPTAGVCGLVASSTLQRCATLPQSVNA